MIRFLGIRLSSSGGERVSLLKEVDHDAILESPKSVTIILGDKQELPLDSLLPPVKDAQKATPGKTETRVADFSPNTPLASLLPPAPPTPPPSPPSPSGSRPLEILPEGFKDLEKEWMSRLSKLKNKGERDAFLAEVREKSVEYANACKPFRGIEQLKETIRELEKKRKDEEGNLRLIPGKIKSLEEKIGRLDAIDADGKISLKLPIKDKKLLELWEKAKKQDPKGLENVPTLEIELGKLLDVFSSMKVELKEEAALIGDRIKDYDEDIAAKRGELSQYLQRKNEGIGFANALRRAQEMQKKLEALFVDKKSDADKAKSTYENLLKETARRINRKLRVQREGGADFSQEVVTDNSSENSPTS